MSVNYVRLEQGNFVSKRLLNVVEILFPTYGASFYSI